MDPKHNRRWLVRAVAVFLMLFVLWVLAVFQLSPAAAGPANLQLRLRSNLVADYTAGPVMRMVRSLRLTVMQDVMQDMGMPEDEAASEMRAMQALLETPVPTATARNLAGDAPFTATPTRTPVPTDTPVPTSTPTRRPLPTATLEPTEEPTKKPKAEKTATPSGGEDDEDPEICCLDLDPAPGDELSVCTLEVISMRVYDEAPSEGIDEAKVMVKYQVPDTGDYVYTSMEKIGGGWAGSAWDATYAGEIHIEGVFEGQELRVWGKVEEDIAGNGPALIGPFTYEMETDCP